MRVRRAIRNVAVAAMLATGLILAPALPAQAIPIAGPGQSVTYTYYAESQHLNVVGGWAYGNCGVNFKWGATTSYYTIRYVTCGGPN